MLSYTLEGPASAPTILFLHGFLGCKEDWKPMIDHLKKDFSCLSIDLPGHGSSAIHEDSVQAIQGTLAALKICPRLIIGYSAGGRIALQLKFSNKDGEPFFLLLSTHTGLISHQEKEIRLSEEKEWLHALEHLPFESFLNHWYARPMFISLKENASLFRSMMQRRIQNNPQKIAHFYQATSLTKMPPVMFPQKSLFLCGEKDPKLTDLYSKQLNRAQYITVSHCSHALHLENPLACAQIAALCAENPL